jgi:hypothetical protein
VQGLNLFVAGFLIWRGMPGFRHIPIVSWVLGLWLILRVAVNHRWWTHQIHEDAVDEAVTRRASAIRDALAADPTSDPQDD